MTPVVFGVPIVLKINETPQSTLSSPIFTTENGHQPLSSSGVRPALGAATFVEPGLSNHHHSDYVNTHLNKQQEVTSTQKPTIITTKEFNPSSTSDISTPITLFPPDMALLSALSKAFSRRIKGLENVRDLFCANEYPESFTGQEAIKMLRDLLDGVPVHYSIKLANILMKATPPLFEPIHYSQKSIIQGALFNSTDEYYTLQEDLSDEDVPTGILTGLLPCYSYMCIPGKPGCYAYSCPNKPGNFTTASEARTVSRPSSTEHMLSSGAEGWVAAKHQIAWAQRVPKVLLRSLSKKEVARQEAINEIIYSEEIYKNDLDTLSQVIVTPLLTKSTIISSRKKREQFVREVFGNYTELNEVSSAMYNDLLYLQHENDYVPMVDDTLIKLFPYFEDPFSQYCRRVSLAEYLVKSEERNNLDFERFIVQVEKSKRMRRLPFRHFLLIPVTHMQRYPLLISVILKKTDKEHPDHAYLVKCLNMVKKVAFLFL